jgi:hypothetical protein
MKVAILIGAVSIGLFFFIAAVASRYGPDATQVPTVEDRFLEKPPRHEAAFIQDWVVQHPHAARHYAFPILFPLDLIFMLFLGGFLGLGSVLSANTIDWLKRFTWLLAIVPAVYVVADFAEDVLLARLLLHAQAINDGSVRIAWMATEMKLLAGGIAIAQTIVVSGLAVALGVARGGPVAR